MRTKKKKKFRWKRVILWTLSIIVVLGISGLFAINYAINKFIDSMANSIELDLEIPATIEPQPTTKSPDNTQSAQPTGSSADQPSLTDAAVPNASENQEDAEQSNSTNPEKPSGQAQVDDPKDNEIGNYAPEVTVEKAQAIKENVSLTEKADVASILMRNLSLSDIKLFQDMVSGGMTVDEKREARSVMLEKLSPEEYNTLSQIAKKYGVSQGKTYDQAEKEEASVSGSQ